MYKKNVIATVLPAHNEERFIAAVIAGIPEWVDIIVVVDDCSFDHTGAVVTGLADAKIQLIQLPENRGVGGATVAGFQQALALGADIVCKIDADGQMPLQHLTELVDCIIEEGYDYAKGNRFMGGIPVDHMPTARLFGNLALTFLNKIASGYWHIFDPQNGFTASRAPVLSRLPLHRLYPRYFFENDMLVHLNILNARVKDVAIPTIYGEEESGIRIGRILITFPILFVRRFMYRIFRKYMLYDFSPIALFLIVGALLFAWGIGFGAWAWIESVISGVPATTGTVMLAVLPLILGFQLLIQAIVLDIQESPR